MVPQYIKIGMNVQATIILENDLPLVVFERAA